MNTNLKALATLVLASTVAVGHAQSASGATGSTPHKTTAKKAHKPVEKGPTVQSQIEELRQELQSQHGQIDSLKQQLSDRDSQLQQAQQAASQAQQAAQAAQAAANQNQQQLTDNASAVSSLQTSVSDLKTNTASIVGTIQDQQTQVKKAIENPDTIHFKGITLSPTGSFVEFATVDRTRATASDIPTPFTSIPLSAADAGHLSEFEMTGRQSRIALNAEGRVPNGVIRGYYEADWLGTGVTSNNNQSNSYVLRQRQIWAQAQLNSGWTFTGGQMWSLATEYTAGLLNKSEAVPLTIDPNYQTGFVWLRQPGFRVVKSFDNRFWVAVSAENAQTLAPSCTAVGSGAACPTNYLYAAAGTSSGLYNSAGQPGATSSAPVTTYAYNVAPDLIAKVAADSSLGHFEVFGVSRFFRNRIYPTSSSDAGAWNDKTVGGGLGGSARFHTFQKKIDVGLKGLWGDGVGRYGTSTLPDLTLRPDAQFALIHGFSSMAFIEGYVTPRFQPYIYYGGDYAGRTYFADGKGFEGYGVPNASNSGCGTEAVPGSTLGSGTSPATTGTCQGANKDVQEVTAGWWYNFYSGPFGRLRQGFQYSYVERNLWGGITGGSPKAIDNVFETSFRYYLP